MDDCIKIVSWNINKSPEAWHELVKSGVDLALLQEAQPPPAEVAERVHVDSQVWNTGAGRPWRTCVAGFTDRVSLRPLSLVPLEKAAGSDLGVSRAGTLAAAEVTVRETGEVFTVLSLYGAWERPASESRSWIYADASVHRVISDLSALLTSERKHKIIAAGDLNILHGHGEGGSPYWRDRYGSVFGRMEALGLPFVGPQAPGGGGQALPWPAELPPDSKNVPTFRTNINRPESAARQLDFVFASGSLLPRVHVRAVNGREEWGPSDHCRVLIEVRQ